MEVKAAATCLHWSPPIVYHHSISPTQTLASAISYPSSPNFVCRYVRRMDRSTLFGTPASPRRNQAIKRACSASLEAFSDEEFSKKIQELALKFQLSDDDANIDDSIDDELEIISDFLNNGEDNREKLSDLNSNNVNFVQNQRQISASNLDSVEPEWLIPASIERKANSVDLPLSLRIIKKKKQWQLGFEEAGESAYSSVKKAFSSMVFILRELQSYTLQMREVLYLEDLQEILVRVQQEMNASFVWLFQQVFSQTPTLMVYVMILLANFTVYSMGSNAAIAASPPPPPSSSSSFAATMESVSVIEDQIPKNNNFDSSIIKSFSVSSNSNSNTASFSSRDGGGGGGKRGKFTSGTDGDGGVSQISSIGNPVNTQESNKHESNLWNSMVEEASRPMKEKSLDNDTIKRFVSPVSAKVEEDDSADYFKTELLYQTGLAREPKNTLLLTNYAQFLYLVAHDYNRAEEYFKKAISKDPSDAEALNKYATFLWMGKSDLWGAEEMYLEAISAEPNNPYYAANYAHFLWNTGGEDTCFPLT